MLNGAGIAGLGRLALLRGFVFVSAYQYETLTDLANQFAVTP